QGREAVESLRRKYGAKKRAGNEWRSLHGRTRGAAVNPDGRKEREEDQTMVPDITVIFRIEKRQQAKQRGREKGRGRWISRIAHEGDGENERGWNGLPVKMIGTENDAG